VALTCVLLGLLARAARQRHRPARARGDVAVVREVIADEQHATVWAAGVTRGLRALYGLGRH
jgi:hypothetical protein